VGARGGADDDGGGDGDGGGGGGGDTRAIHSESVAQPARRSPRALHPNAT